MYLKVKANYMEIFVVGELSSEMVAVDFLSESFMCLNGDCIILTPSALILLEPYSKHKQQYFSVRCWVNLGSLDFIRRYSINHGKLSLYWKCPTNKESQEELTFTLHNSAQISFKT